MLLDIKSSKNDDKGSEQCPICGSDGNVTRSLNLDDIQRKLKEYFLEEIPNDISFDSYDIIQCQHCELEYASPFIPGSDAFYRWITSREGYYPSVRWEWIFLTEEFKRVALTKPISILDVGCGSGVFMSTLNNIPGINIIGLDTTPESISDCRSKNLSAHCMTIDQFNQTFPEQRFDYVVSFHCLEHVTNPKLFVQSMLSITKDGGKVLVSTPYSPMSFEKDWIDILNCPPHHITRWNDRTYDELANQLNCQVKYYMPPSGSLIERTSTAFRLATVGKLGSTSKSRLVFKALTNPIKFSKVLFHQLTRPKINNQVAANVILVELKSSES